MPFTKIEQAIAADRPRRARHRRRRRGSRERRRPHHGGREDHARDDGLHDPPHERRDLHADRGRAARRAPAPAHGGEQHRGPAHRVHRLGRRAARHDHRHLRGRPRDDRAGAARSADTGPDDLARPGHIFPLRYREGGVLKRAGPHRGRGRPRPPRRAATRQVCSPRSSNDDGTMARLPELERFAAEHGLLLISIADLIRYRRHREKLVRRVSEARIPTRHGDFTAYVFESLLDGVEHLAFVRGEVVGERATCWCASTPSASPATCSGRCAAIAACSSTSRSSASPGGRRASSCTCAGTRDAASGSGTSCGRTRSRTRAATPSRPTWSSAFPPTPRVRHRLPDPRRPRDLDDAAHDEQSRRSTAASRATVSRSSSACRCTSRRPTRTSRTCARSRRRSVTSSTSTATADI